ncbi:uncharacterized protein ARMOST_07917 [Armillaria ostoyae]|uniref:Uncharacterized protein n=2 Tax=Armillaria TaxID=47424 RepID=A0A284R775_ARMOS|nr:hypothetical protein EV421DRAFT_1902480 [Armillaria borealis]SJL04550.1 uncharacterized protein ARMOST_07917 [Armillaria ostoyae]
MNFNASNECNPVLVAPRPVRLATASFSNFIVRPASRVEEINKLSSAASSDSRELSSSPSLRSSPRSALSTEALEEFLSILRPSLSLFPPHSPVLRTTTAFALKAIAQASDSDSAADTGSEAVSVGLEMEDELNFRQYQWFSNAILSSPISRTNTRNPFQRQRQLAITPSPTVVNSLQLSPAAIPLPLPTPDEVLE